MVKCSFCKGDIDLNGKYIELQKVEKWIVQKKTSFCSLKRLKGFVQRLK